MSGAEDRDAGRDPDFEGEMQAAEYVLGTLDARERVAFERALPADPVAAGRVRAWESRLAPLMAGVPAIPPPAHIRPALLRALPGEADREAAMPVQLATLRRRVRRWQGAAAAAGLIAAGLALFVAVETKPFDAAARRTERYLAVVQGGGAVPALIVQVDLRTRTAQVRPVAVAAPAGRSLELWYVGAAGTTSIGLVGAAPSRITLPKGASPDGVIAVSVEPEGGSPSGQATGPVIYTGKLLAE